MARASGRAFLALGQALGNLFERKEAERLRQAEREAEREDRDQWRRAQLLTQPGVYESPDTRLSVMPPALETPELPSPPTRLREGPGGLRASAEKVLAPPDLDVPELPTVRQERTPLPEGHTRPLPGVAYNPRFEAEQEEARNRRLVEAATAAGADPEMAALLEHTGPSGLRTVLPAPDDPPNYSIQRAEQGYVGINPRDPTDIVQTGLRPPPSATSTTAGAREARLAETEQRRQLEREVGERALAMVEALRARGEEMPIAQLTGALMASFPAEAKPPRAIAEGAAARALSGERSQSLLEQRREQQLEGDEGGALAEYLRDEEAPEEPATPPPEVPAAPPPTRRPIRQEAARPAPRQPPARPPATRQPARQQAARPAPAAASAEEAPAVPDDLIQRRIEELAGETNEAGELLTDEEIVERLREEGLIIGSGGT